MRSTLTHGMLKRWLRHPRQVATAWRRYTRAGSGRRTKTALLLILSAGLNVAPAVASSGERGASIFDAIRRGDASALRAALRQPDEVSHRDAHANTPLIYAAAYGNVHAIRLLLEKGADPNASDEAGVTALMRAAGDYQKVRLLLQYGADPNKKSALGNTALILAARIYPSAKTVAALLAKNAEVNTTNVFGGSAILTAAASGDMETLRLLLERGADVNAAPVRSLDGMIWGGGRSPLAWAALMGYQDCAELLLQRGASINSAEGFGTPLSQAVWHSEKQMVKFLLDHGADPNVRDRMADFAPLHWAASTDHAGSDIAQLLLQHGADVNAEGGEPVDALLGVAQTPLLLAEKRGQTELVTALLDAGANPGSSKRSEPAKISPVAQRTVSFASVREAVERAIPRLQETASASAAIFVQRGQTCNSCHQQYIPMMALGIAHRRGFERNEAKARDLRATVLSRPEPGANREATFHPAGAPTLGYKLLGLDFDDVAPSAGTDAIVAYLAATQGRDGNWVNPLPRPPIQSGDISATALAIHALQKYPLPCRKTEFAKRVETARLWLLKQQPVATDELVFQLLGLSWAGERPSTLARLQEKLRSHQRADGGWGQLPSLPSDAYATGQALFALHTAGGLATSDPVYQRGVKSLLETQLADGTWHVRRRAFPFQPTMPSGFPHGRDSWVSAAGTSWAVAALSVVAPVKQSPPALSAMAVSN